LFGFTGVLLALPVSAVVMVLLRRARAPSPAATGLPRSKSPGARRRAGAPLPATGADARNCRCR
jgi:hypothetical protein